MSLRDDYAWALAEAKAAMPIGVDVRMVEFNFGETVALGVFAGPHKTAILLAGADRDESGYHGQIHHTDDEIRELIAHVAFRLRELNPAAPTQQPAPAP